jgi:mRNA interferase RelE/StbE
MWQITYHKSAVPALGRMPRNIARRIRNRIEQLAQNPYAPNNNVTKLQGRDGYRLRVGHWRIIYDLNDEQLIVLILAIGPRGSIYQ